MLISPRTDGNGTAVGILASANARSINTALVDQSAAIVYDRYEEQILW